jgi:hypothetical protein
MAGDQGVPAGAGGSAPSAAARPPAAGLVEPRHLGLGHPVAHVAEELVQAAGGTLGHCGHRGFADRGGEQLGERGRGALLRQELPHVEVEDDRGDPRPVGHRRGHAPRGRGAGAHRAPAATRDELMLSHPHPQRGQVEHLAALQAHLGGLSQVGAAAAAAVGLVAHPLVRIGDLRQRRPRMSLLPTRLAPALTAQRARSRLGERRVRRWWLRRIPAVPSQLPLQLRDLGPKLYNRRPKLRVSPRQAPHRTGDDRQPPHHDRQPAAEANATRRSSHNRHTSHTSTTEAAAT